MPKLESASCRHGENLWSFIADLAEDPGDPPVIKAMADVSETLKVATVAEYLVRQESGPTVCESRHLNLQGHPFGKPF